MKQVLRAAALAVLCPTLALAGDDSGRRQVGYAFVAPGAITCSGSTLHAGGGMAVFVWHGLAASFEGGYLMPFPFGFRVGVGVVSPNAVYHSGTPARGRLAPFVTAGASLLFRDGYMGGVNVGAGASYWLTKRVGLRLELRDHLPAYGRAATVHVWGVRAGVTWVR
jgi:hypothetical protein